MKKYKLLSIVFMLSLLTTSCSKDTVETTNFVELNYNFINDTELWQGDFADYPVDEDEFYELQFQFSKLPIPLNVNLGSLKQSGSNHSDDLFMFIKREIPNLLPNTNYTISFNIEIASNVADRMSGIGGSPGEGVTIKAGAVSFEPTKKNNDGFYLMNLDKGNQSSSGTDMKTIGEFSNDTELNEYTLKILECQNCITVKTNNDGKLWVLIGTDSGFEGTTTIYYNAINIKLEKV